jgi:hypothetical protein
MSGNLISRFKIIVARLTASLAFYPAVIAVVFLMAFWGLINLDDSATDKHLKSSW